jgi:hypothetical protein
MLIIALIIGSIVSGITGIGFLFWVVSIFVFICGLPFALVNGFIQDKIDYIQDRKDYRMTMHEMAEDERMDRYLDNFEKLNEDHYNEPDIYIDNRQVHFHNYYDNNCSKDEKGRFISNGKKRE